MASEKPTFLASGQRAKLIPTMADAKKEERATSSLLATFMVVPLFAKDVLSSAGAPVGKRSRIECYTEVTFKSPKKESKARPDGLIVIKNGAKTWTALIESKIGNAELTNKQVEEYLELAKGLNINAVITISNQFATTPTHHPLKINKKRSRSVELYHFSWLSIKTKAVLLTGRGLVNDPEQAFILSELVSYLEHSSSGVSALTKMPSGWKEVCHSIQQGTPLNKNGDSIERSVSGWHQLLRHLSLNLSMAIRQPVGIVLSRAREKDPEIHFREDCHLLSKECKLDAEFEVHNAASKLLFSADFLRRTISISMKLESPKDKRRATASINWVTRQLKGANLENVYLKAYWPKRTPMTIAPLAEVLENPSAIIPSEIKAIPKYFEVVRIIDLNGRFTGVKTFVEESSKEFLNFYQDVGQQLSKWVARAPRLKEPESAVSSIPTIFSSEVVILAEDNGEVRTFQEDSMQMSGLLNDNQFTNSSSVESNHGVLSSS
jgi:hypothetical protein